MKMLTAASLIILLWLVLGVLGGAEATRFLAGNAVGEPELLLGASYVLAYFAAVIAAPILLAAALVRS